jgi:hypothetical protein
MASQIDIFNMALSHIGATATVQDLNERSAERIICSRFYDTTRDALLAYKACPWSFAIKVVPLADIGSPPEPWAYRYAMPNDCITALYIAQDIGNNLRDDQQVPFQIVTADAGRALLTNQPGASLCYVSRVTETERYSSPFVEALAMRLAAVICMPIAKSANMRDETASLAEQLIQVAMAHELNQAQHGLMPESAYIAEIHA